MSKKPWTATLSVLKDKDMTDAKFQAVERENERILVSHWRSRLCDTLQEMSRFIETTKSAMIGRAGELKSLEQSTLSSLTSGEDIDVMIGNIRTGFHHMIRTMEQDINTLAALSNTDKLTGLNNRRALDDYVAVLDNGQRGTPYCAIMVDIDHFKSFNDTFGHLIGDKALTTVSSIISECENKARREDRDISVFRYGGEEFVLVACGMDRSEGASLAETIRASIENNTFRICDTNGNVARSGIKLTISAGVAHKAPETDGSAWDTIRKADEALYRAKANGRNRVCAC